MYQERKFDRDRGFRRGNFAPINVGDEMTVKIEAVGEKGDGLARVKGFVLFVPGTKEGEEVRVKITKVLKKVGFAEVVGKAEKGEGSESSESEEMSEDSYDDSTEASEDSDSEDSEEF